MMLGGAVRELQLKLGFEDDDEEEYAKQSAARARAEQVLSPVPTGSDYSSRVSSHVPSRVPPACLYT